MEISPQEVREALESGSIRLIDVRGQDEWETARIAGATLASKVLVDEMMASWDKDAAIVFYCHSGVRSLSAVHFFAQKGFTNVRAWPAVSKPGRPRSMLPYRATRQTAMELDTVFARNEQVVSRKIVDELILVPMRKDVADMETLYTLNEVGARVYELIDGSRPVGEIVSAVVNEFDVTEEQAESDVREFVEQLLEIESIHRVESKT